MLPLLRASILLGLVAASCVHAQDMFDFDLDGLQISEAEDRWRLSGFVESRLQYAENGEWLSRRHSGQFELRFRNKNWRGFVTARAQYDAPTRDFSSPFRSEIVNAYLNYANGQHDFTIGKQRIAWGTADGVSTIDRVNAIDLRDPIGNARTASRRPSWLVRWRMQVLGGDLEGVWLPRGRDRKLPEFGSHWEPDGLHLLRETEISNGQPLEIRDPHHSEGGLRYTVYGQGFDWGLAVFNGYTDAPNRLRQTPEGTLELAPERIQTWNLNAAMGLASSTLRGEVAYTPRITTDGERSKLAQLVLGWDKTFFTNLYVNLQLFADRFTTTGARNQGVTFAVTNSWLRDAINYGARGQIANGKQSSIELFADYTPNDHLKLSFRVLRFDGDPGTALGDFEDNDLLELVLSWSF